MPSPGIIIGKTNRQKVHDWQLLHPWGKQHECATDLGLSIMAVNRHVSTIRKIWREDPHPAAPGTTTGAFMNDINTASREQSFGEKAVGLSFNPSGDSEVEACKREFAAVIDRLHNLRSGGSDNSEVKRMASVAITEAQTAQMWAVKAITWRD